MHEHDPSQLSEPRTGTSHTASFLVFFLATVFIVLLAFALWPTRDNRGGTAMTDSSRVERTTPANKPQTDMTAPAAPKAPAQ